MSASSDSELLRRLIEFELRLERESSEHVERFDWGRLIVNSDTPAIWSGNFLEVEAPGVGSEELAALADDLLSRHGLGHRLVVPADPERGAELAPRFRQLGWRVDRSLYMVLRRPVDRPRPAALEVSREKVEAPGRRGLFLPPQARSSGGRLISIDLTLDQRH